jgi:hypothetical protein
MNSQMRQIVLIILSAGSLGSGTPAVGQSVIGPARIDPSRDPLYLSNQAGPTDGYTEVDQGSVGDGSRPRGGCVTCADTEDEENCAIPTDTVNGGCNSNPPVFGTLECEQVFCGTSASDGVSRDTDWWMFVLQQTTNVGLTVTADFPVQIGFGDLRAGCPIDTLIEGVFGDACAATSLELTLERGTYIAFVAPQFGEAVECGAPFTGSLSCALDSPCACPGDFNDDGDVDMNDLALLLSSYNMRPSNECMDFDHNSVVTLHDLADFLSLFGSSCP